MVVHMSGDAIRHKPGILGFLRQIGFMGATALRKAFLPSALSTSYHERKGRATKIFCTMQLIRTPYLADNLPTTREYGPLKRRSSNKFTVDSDRVTNGNLHGYPSK